MRPTSTSFVPIPSGLRKNGELQQLPNYSSPSPARFTPVQFTLLYTSALSPATRCERGTGNENGKTKVRLRGKKSNHNQTLTMVESMWGCVNSCPTSSEKKDSGPRHIRDAAAHLAARANNKSVETDLCPYSKNRVPSDTYS